MSEWQEGGKWSRIQRKWSLVSKRGDKKDKQTWPAAAVQDFLGAAGAGNIYLQQKYTSCLTENGVLLPLS